MQAADPRDVCSRGRVCRFDCLQPRKGLTSGNHTTVLRHGVLRGRTRAAVQRTLAEKQSEAPRRPLLGVSSPGGAVSPTHFSVCQASRWRDTLGDGIAALQVQHLRQQLELGAMLAIAGSATAGAAFAAAGEGLAKSLSSAVPESVATTVAPVVERTSAFIPGLVGDSPLREGIVSGFLLILFSELGDKTFFLALLLALKESKLIVFAGTFGALAVMTVISVGLGQLLHQVDELEFAGSKLPLDDYLAVALLIFFGVKTILDARDADESAAEEREEAKEEVSRLSTNAAGVFLSTFTLVFAAEWGDKSFLATIALAAASSPVGVVLGAIGGHGFATGIAVAGGSVLGKYLDEKVVQYLGGSLFLVFAAATIVDIVRGV